MSRLEPHVSLPVSETVSMFANAVRTHSTQSRLQVRVLTATHAALPATRSISSLVAFRTAVPKNVSLSVSRSFTTSQVARNEESLKMPPELHLQSTDTPNDTISRPQIRLATPSLLRLQRTA
jgi:hypothetical protein